MVSDLPKVGLLALGIVVLSPQGRKNLGKFLNGLAEAGVRDARRKEAQRRAEIAISALQNYTSPQPLPVRTPNSPATQAFLERTSVGGK